VNLYDWSKAWKGVMYKEECNVLNRSARPMKWVMRYKDDCIPSKLQKIGKKRKEKID
jgi:hypothetical protein